MLKFKIVTHDESLRPNDYPVEWFALDAELCPVFYYRGTIVNNEKATEICLFNGDVVIAAMSFKQFDNLYLSYLERMAEIDGESLTNPKSEES
jgi:hypothetical protein